MLATTEYRFPLVLVVTLVCGLSSAGAAPEKHFSGPFKITITASKTINATVKSTYLYP